MIRRYKLSEISLDQILCRDIRAEKNVDAIVDEIIADVRANGDEALKKYAEKFDCAKLDALEVTKEEIDAASESGDEPETDAAAAADPIDDDDDEDDDD